MREPFWIFDLDNTLYSPHSDVFPQIHQRMSQFLTERLGLSDAQADEMRHDYFIRYGTTMRGLMVEHNIAADDFMDYVHNVDLSVLEPNPELINKLTDLQGEKIIFTNADRHHATRVLTHLGMTHLFSAIFDIADGDYICKPHPEPYHALLKRFNVAPKQCIMIDDMEANLRIPHNLGMRTIWIRHEAKWLRSKPERSEHYPHCHKAYKDVSDALRNDNYFLSGINKAIKPC
jgi:putative hydrolase of the HAD superfamily